jgi:predicted Zn-dependent peptidase
MTLRRRDPLVRETVHADRLPGGLEVLVIPKRGLHRKAAVLAARYGSIDVEIAPPGEPPARTPPGIAHFLEHQLFKKPDGDRLADFGRDGASANAFTDYGATAYHFTCTEAFESSLDRLVDLVARPWFAEENVARERLIIEQELRMYGDMPDYRLFRNLAGALYRDHPVRLEIGGTVESLREITAETLRRCHAVFYHPANLTLVLAGDFDVSAVLKAAGAIAAKAFGKPGGGAAARPARRVPAEPPEPARREVRESMTVTRPRVLLGFKDARPSLRGAALLERELAIGALLNLLFGRASAFFAREYARGLLDDSFSASHAAESTFGFSLVGGETETPERLRDAVLAAVRRARGEQIGKREAERARRLALGRYLRAFDTPEGAAFLLLDCRFKEADPFDWPGLVKRLTPRRLHEILEEHLDEARCAVSIATPGEGRN